MYEVRQDAEAGHAHCKCSHSRFAARTLVFGEMVDAAKGLMHFMNVDRNSIVRKEIDLGLEGIRGEFDALLEAARETGNPDEASAAEHAHECMRYVLDEEAGSSSLIFSNAPDPRDCDANGLRPDRKTNAGLPMRLQDFARSDEARTAGLDITHVAALRIYSTAAYAVINDPLRDEANRRLAWKESSSERRVTASSSRTEPSSPVSPCLELGGLGEVSGRTGSDRPPHPLPLTTSLIADAVPKLRAVEADQESACAQVSLYRGIANAEARAEFLKRGGTEVAPMSTTSDVRVAMQYALKDSTSSLLIRLDTKSAMQRGADIRFLSAFPGEKEYLLPPLTYLQPIKSEEMTIGGRRLTVIAAEARQ